MNKLTLFWWLLAPLFGAFLDEDMPSFWMWSLAVN